MRTTLDIDEDILDAAKELDRRERVSAGQVVSRLLRLALTGQSRDQLPPEAGEKGQVAGFRPFGPRGKIVTNDRINALRDQEGV
jgi:hypothetical protein